jgi:hypothetical protein
MRPRIVLVQRPMLNLVRPARRIMIQSAVRPFALHCLCATVRIELGQCGFRLILEIDIRKLLSRAVLHHEGSTNVLDSPRRREAAVSMQPLMNGQPQPACSRPENNSADRSDADHCGAKH